MICQVFPPDPAAVGQCFADLCNRITERGVAVTMVTSARGYHDPRKTFPSRERRGLLDVRRVTMPELADRSIVNRIVGALWFVASATARGIVSRRPDAVVVSTSPPMAPLAGLIVAARHRVPLVHWLMDLNPDQAIEIGVAHAGSRSARLLDWLNRRLLRRASCIIALDQAMADRIAAKGQRNAELLVIPPWASVALTAPNPDLGHAFRRAHDLVDRFVVMYSGNHSLVHPLDTLLDAAARLVDDPRFAFVFIGDGHGKSKVDACGLPNVLSLPYQPRETLDESLSAADLHVVTMGDRMLGVVHPSKVYGVLAVARPLIYFGPSGSHVDRIAKHDIGWSVRHGDVDAAVEALRDAAGRTSAERRDMGLRARHLLETEFHPDRLQAQVADVVCSAG